MNGCVLIMIFDKRFNCLNADRILSDWRCNLWSGDLVENMRSFKGHNLVSMYRKNSTQYCASMKYINLTITSFFCVSVTTSLNRSITLIAFYVNNLRFFLHILLSVVRFRIRNLFNFNLRLFCSQLYVGLKRFISH